LTKKNCSILLSREFHYISKQTIYWNEMKDVNFTTNLRFIGSIISFKMLDGNSYSMPVKYIAGEDYEIYNTVVDYFNNKQVKN